MEQFAIATDTSTICLFDLSAMRHRKEEAGDWWSLPKNELAEIQNRNAIFLNVESDGIYQVTIKEGRLADAPVISLKIPSGVLFVGPGEEMTGGGFEPTGDWGGKFISLVPGDYLVSMKREADLLNVRLCTHEPFENDFRELIRV